MLLVAAFVLAALAAMRRAAVSRRRALQGVPDAGVIGMWTVIGADGETLALADALPDGLIGSGRLCSVRVRALPAVLARFTLEADGLHVTPLRAGTIRVNGQSVTKKTVLRHGATLCCNGVTLRLTLFACGETGVTLQHD